MRFIALIKASNGNDDPGHMVIGTMDTADLYVGFRFDPDDLPPAYRDPKLWKAYLFKNTVDGHISDETQYIAFLMRTSQLYHRKEWSCMGNNSLPLPPPDKWRKHALYSFNPDCFHTDAEPCYNCVTWGTMILNRVVRNALEPVRQGRVKLMIQQFLGE